MDQSFLQKMVGMLRGGQSAQAAVNPAYTNYAREAAAMGQTPMTPQQYALQQQQAAQIPQQPPVATQPPPEAAPKEFRF